MAASEVKVEDCACDDKGFDETKFLDSKKAGAPQPCYLPGNVVYSCTNPPPGQPPQRSHDPWFNGQYSDAVVAECVKLYEQMQNINSLSFSRSLSLFSSSYSQVTVEYLKTPSIALLQTTTAAGFRMSVLCRPHSKGRRTPSVITSASVGRIAIMGSTRHPTNQASRIIEGLSFDGFCSEFLKHQRKLYSENLPIIIPVQTQSCSIVFATIIYQKSTE